MPFDLEAWQSAVSGDPRAGRTESTRTGRARMGGIADARGRILGLTHSQLAERLGFSHGASADRYITALERAGYLKVAKPGVGGHRARPAEYRLVLPRRVTAKAGPKPKGVAQNNAPSPLTQEYLEALSDEALADLTAMLADVQSSRMTLPVAA